MPFTPRTFVATFLVASLLLPLQSNGQLVRQANTTLNLPVSLPTPSGYSLDATVLGSLRFDRPTVITSPPGETNRLFIVEHETGLVKVVDLTTLGVQTFLDLSSFLSSNGIGTLKQGVSSHEPGVLGFAFHPGYANSSSPGYRKFFIYYSITATSDGLIYNCLSSFKVQAGNANSADTSTHQMMIKQVKPRNYTGTQDNNDTTKSQVTEHNGGDLHFGPDGYLYLSLGDGGVQHDGKGNGRLINGGFFGSIMRIDVDKLPGSLAPNSDTAFAAFNQNKSAIIRDGSGNAFYAVPPDNPYIGFTTWNGQTFAANTVRTEIWAAGFRNPWRFAFDSLDGRLFLADVGQDTPGYEEVDIITKGANYGWSWWEGNHALTSYTGPANGPSGPWVQPSNSTFTFPIGELTHDSAATNYGKAIIGGVIYRGANYSDLYGSYVFADNVSRNVFKLAPPVAPSVNWTLTTLIPSASFPGASNDGPSCIGVDPRNGDILIAVFLKATGSPTDIIYRLTRNDTGVAPPARLSLTGAFSNLTNLTPNAGIVAFEPNVAFWSDHAIKTRWFSVPNVNDKLTFSQDGNWTFPNRTNNTSGGNGTVWIKHFELETTRGDPSTKRRLETRFLVKNANGVYGLTYKWRVDNSDADLVPEGGQDEVINIIDSGTPTTQTWHYPTRNECVVCHTSVGGFGLGFNTRQMNHVNVYGGVSQNQITALSNGGYFTSPVTNVNNLPAFATASDTTQSLEWRVRSYLAVNCVQCHQPGGSASNSAFWNALPTVATDSAGIINGTLFNNNGNSSYRVIVPGNTSLSVMHRRIVGTTPGLNRMPPLATNVRNLEAEQLVADWINLDLPSRLSFTQWQTQYFGSTSAPEANAEADPDGDGQKNKLEYLTNTNPTTTIDLWSMTPQLNGSLYQVSFPQVANRAFIIETSTDLINWSVWDAPGNSANYSATTQTRTLFAPIDVPVRFFRARISAP